MEDNFKDESFKNGVKTWGFNKISHQFITLNATGQTEVLNREFVRGLKMKLDHVEGSWVNELPDILWAYRTTPRDSTGLTPFHLVYGGEAVVPVEVGCQSARVEAYTNAEDNASRRAAELDLITETREQTNMTLRLSAAHESNVQQANETLLF
ncbi:uncharacterized protein LOC141832623 [Curcuma longa]|uniref:uncharacterized protein LOC141832623 n=1 Tax=Curcuma longa TaxID=136217 RepID=UPI003D9DC75A